MTKQEAEIVARILAFLEDDGGVTLPDDMAVLRKNKTFATEFDDWALFLRRERDHRQKFHELMVEEFGGTWEISRRVTEDDTARVWEKAQLVCIEEEK